MSTIYYNLIKRGKISIKDVPAHLKDEVQSKLDSEKP